MPYVAGQDYSPDQFGALFTEVEKQGGALLPDYCTGELVTFKSPNGSRTSKVQTCHCHKEGRQFSTMTVTPYDPADTQRELDEMKGRGAGFVRACIVCDSVGAWPRFEGFDE